jgi:hypothetical protein
MSFDGFKPIEKDNGLFKVEIEYLDEGRGGEYDENDPEDLPLLRFTVFEMAAGEWAELPDGSYCTRLPATSDRAVVEEAANLILTRITNAFNTQESLKTVCERLSWMDEKWVRGVVK